jgi:hypothetical protein
MLKRLLGALGAVAAIWLVVFFVSNREGGEAEEITGPIATFFEGADSVSLSTVRFSMRPQDSVVLRNVGGVWEVSGFRSDSGAVSRFFQTLGSSQVVSIAATNPENHGRMGVYPDTAAYMELEQGGSTRRIFIGVEGPRPGTVYARLPDEDAVYLLDSGIRSYVFRHLDDWRNRRMLALDTTRIDRIIVQRDGESATLVRDSVWMLADGGAANARTVENMMRELSGGLVASRFVAPTDSIGMLPVGGTTTVYDESGAQLARVTVGSGTGDRWATAEGDSVRYRIPPFRVDAIVPRVATLRQ